MAQYDVKKAEELEQKYDSGLHTRAVGPWLLKFSFLFSIFFAGYHYITAGIGVPVDYWHMGFHMSGVILLVFIGYPLIKNDGAWTRHPNTWWRYGNVPIWDWLLIVCGIAGALYIGITWYEIEIEFLGGRYVLPEQVLRQGNPATIDIVFGTMLIIVLLEAVRRTLGIIVPIIILVFTGYAVFGQYIPIQILTHPGISWSQYINNMYFPAEGIYGVTLWIVSTVVFHFVLFGVLAQRMGLGQFFVDIATVIAGRYTGGLAKVSVVSSAFFGTISGSSIANTVSTGSLTIPNMKRMGYPGHLAGGVEASASAGGQITPPIMGAAAFVMAEFLEVPYTTVVLAALVPAAMHYIGVISIVHFQAKRLGLKGMPAEEIPKVLHVLKRGWPTAVPLAVLIYVLFSGYSPHMAAFWGISSALAIGFLNPMHRIGIRDVFDGCVMGVKYALAVGAVCSAIGIVVGVVNSTGPGIPARLHGDEQCALHRRKRAADLLVPASAGFLHRSNHAVHFAGPDRDHLHPDGGRPADDRALHHAGHGGPAGARQSRRAAAGLAPFRALLRRHLGDYATGLCVRLCGGGHCRREPVPHGPVGFLSGDRQTSGADGLRLFTGNADRHRYALHLGRFHQHDDQLFDRCLHAGDIGRGLLPDPHVRFTARGHGAFRHPARRPRHDERPLLRRDLHPGAGASDLQPPPRKSPGTSRIGPCRVG